jgi:hypothetical protein
MQGIVAIMTVAFTVGVVAQVAENIELATELEPSRLFAHLPIDM